MSRRTPCWTRHTAPIRSFLLLGLLLASFLPTSLPAQDPAPEETEAADDPAVPDRSNPRALFRSFIEAWNQATGTDRRRAYDAIESPAQRTALLRAIRCLGTGVDASAPTEEQFGRAMTVIDVLNFHGRIDFESIPVAVGDPGTFSLQTAVGPIETTRTDDGWVFPERWVTDAAPRMVLAFEAMGRERYRAFSLRDYLPDVLSQRALFLEHWQWLGIASLLILAWLVHRIAVFVTRYVLTGWISRNPRWSGIAEAIRNTSGAVGLFAAAALLAFLHRFLELPPFGERALSILARIVAAAGAMLLAYRLADVAGAKLRETASRTDSRLDDQLAPMLERSLKILITIGAFLFVLDNLDVDILSFLAGLGVVGIGVGLAARDTFANFFGSVTVFADKPFQVGDWIVVGDVEGTVEEIGFRTTRIRTFYNSLIALPNAKLVDSAIDNMGRRRWRRYSTKVGILYSTPAERIEAFCAGIREIVRANERMRQDYAMVHLNGFGPSSLEILVYVFFDVADWKAELAARQDFMLEVIRLAEHLGVGFAFPTTSIHVESTPENPLSVEPVGPVDALRQQVDRFGPSGDLARPDGSEPFRPV